MLSPQDKVRLFNAVTEFDRKASKRRGYNPHAIGHYARGLNNLAERVENGETLRAAIMREFIGRLCDVLLRAVSLPLMTKEEARGQ